MRFWAYVGLLALAPACVRNAAATAVAPPSSSSISSKAPGGDSDAPESYALERLITEAWGKKRDRWKTLQIFVPDGKLWRRVRFFGQPTRATFRYGDAHHAVLTTLYVPSAGASSPAECLERQVTRARTIAEGFGTEYRELQRLTLQQGDGEIPVITFSAKVDNLFHTGSFVGFAAGLPSFEGTCLVQGLAVRSAEDPDRANKVLERWIREGIFKTRWEPKLKEAPETLAR